MVKFLVILFLLVVLIGIIYWLLHPYIKMARKALGFIQEVRTGTLNVGGPSTRERQPVNAQKLVACARCGTWVPTGRALQARGSEFCSSQCRDRA